MQIRLDAIFNRLARYRPSIHVPGQLALILHRIAIAVWVLLGITLLGTAGFFLIDDKKNLSDALFMTIITITTVGYGEVVRVDTIWARLFVGLISVGGFGTLTFLFTSFTVFFLEADLDTSLRRRRMQKQIDNLSGHYIVCGLGRVGRNVVSELAVTGCQFVVIEPNLQVIEEHAGNEPGMLWLQGDATDDDVLMLAGIERAAGVFAVISDDAKNLMVSLSAKQLNPQARVVARGHEVQNSVKIRKAGADAVVLPDFTGGMRIVSMMIRPHVVGILDDMMRSERGIRMEEIPVPEALHGHTLASLGLDSPEYILVAVRDGSSWHFNPEKSFLLSSGQVLVMMATPEGRRQVEAQLA